MGKTNIGISGVDSETVTKLRAICFLENQTLSECCRDAINSYIASMEVKYGDKLKTLLKMSSVD